MPAGTTAELGLPARIYLTGFMAAGKTAVGAALAGILGYGFTDLDRAIEERTGETVSEIFARRGEAGFRDLEHACLARTGDSHAVVVATGGGTMAFERNRALIRRLGTSVWLDPPLELLLARLERSSGKRPLYSGAEEARALYHRRRDAYRMSDLRIETSSGETAQAVAARIASSIRERRCAI